MEVFDLGDGALRNQMESEESLFAHEICLHNDRLYFFMWQAYHMTEDPKLFRDL